MGGVRQRARLSISVVAAIALTVGGAAITAPGADAAPAWAPAGSAAIHPGVQTFTDGGQCTANFVFFNTAHVYIGQAAHCASTATQTDTNGCTTPSLPLGTQVEVGGASQPGTLVYSSWLTMQAAGEHDADTCEFNDLAFVELTPADAARVNPSIPHWGGPVGVNGAGAPVLSRVFSYGNSILRLGLALLSPKEGFSLGDTGNGWSHEVTTITPGIPGDSGSAFLDAEGRALGVLSTIQVGVPFGVSNGVGDVGRELAYANAHSGLGVTLANGTEPFTPGRLPLGI
jgi:hypothetical protein